MPCLLGRKQGQTDTGTETEKQTDEDRSLSCDRWFIKVNVIDEWAKIRVQEIKWR
jgi:hypothetical protein